MNFGMAIRNDHRFSRFIYWWSNISLFVYFVSGLYGLYFGSTQSLTLAALVGVANLFLGLFRELKKDTFSREVMVLALIVTINMTGFLLSCCYYNKFDAGFFAFIIASVGIAHLLVTLPISYRLICSIFYFVSFYFSLFIALGVDANFALAFGDAAQSSRNGVSVIMINLCALVYMVGERQSRKAALSPAILTFLICTWTYGRSGIIVSALILAGVFIRDITWKRVALAGLILGTTSLFVDFEALELFSYFERLQNLGDSDRQNFMKVYLSYIDVETFLFGFYLRATELFNDNTNPHNSFIYLHSLTGVYGFFLLALTTTAIFRSILKNWFYTLLLVAVLLRAATDSVLFFDFYDFIPYALITLALTCKKKQRAPKNELAPAESGGYVEAHSICN
jgi:hypothetical protein